MDLLYYDDIAVQGIAFLHILLSTVLSPVGSRQHRKLLKQNKHNYLRCGAIALYLFTFNWQFDSTICENDNSYLHGSTRNHSQIAKSRSVNTIYYAQIVQCKHMRQQQRSQLLNRIFILTLITLNKLLMRQQVCG